jgi:hypothetical protein
MRITRNNLVAVARAQGCTTTPEASRILIKRGDTVVVLSEDGSMYRGDVLLHLARAMRVSDAVRALKLDTERGQARGH